MKNALWSMYINGLIIVLKKIKSRWDHKHQQIPERERESKRVRRRRDKEILIRDKITTHSR